MTTPDDARAGIRALLNHVPATMAATRTALAVLAAVRTDAEDDKVEVSLKDLRQLVSKFAATFTACIVTLENEIEALNGRPGLPDSTWDAIMGEFGMGG
jgi:hypothetical protein